MSDASWKAVERKVGKALGLVRRIGLGRAVGDLSDHPRFSVEVKYRKNLPMKFIMDGLEQARRYDPTKEPVLVCKEAGKQGEIVSMYLTGFTALVKAAQGE